MVRLKAEGLGYWEGNLPCFNSNMVRLKVVWKGNYDRIFTLFQFQYGSIKRISQKSVRQAFWSFNSNMVRLKANRREKAHNPLYVSIPIWFD